MLFTIFLILNIINLIIFILAAFGERIEVYKFIDRLYKYITVPMSLYSVYYLLYVIFNRAGIYLNIDVFVVTIIMCSLSIIGNIGKIIRICVRDYMETIDIDGFLDMLMIATALFVGVFIFSTIVVSFAEIDEKTINLEKIQFKEIVYNDLSDIDDNNQITVILNENNDKMVIDLDDYTLEEFEYNRTEKYIKKSAKYSKAGNIFNITNESEEYKYSIYTGDKEEYDILKKYCD